MYLKNLKRNNTLADNPSKCNVYNAPSLSVNVRIANILCITIKSRFEINRNAIADEQLCAIVVNQRDHRGFRQSVDDVRHRISCRIKCG